MTKWIRRLLAGVGGTGLIVAMAAFPSFAGESHGKMMHHGHDDEQGDHHGHYVTHLLKHAKEIGLTQEQIGKLKALQLDFKRSEVRLDADTEVAKLELHALLDDEQADFNAIQAKVDQLKKSEGALLVAAIKTKRNAMAMLTPEQREKERAHREHMRSAGRHGAGMGGMMGGSGGMGGMMGGMGGMGSMGGSGHGQGGSQGSGGSGGDQQHQH